MVNPFRQFSPFVLGILALGANPPCPATAPTATAPAAQPVDIPAAEAAFHEAEAAQATACFALYQVRMEDAVAQLPDPSRLFYRLSGARLSAQDPVGAVEAFRRQVDAGIYRDPRPDPIFASLLPDPAFQAELTRLDKLREPKVASSELFSVDAAAGRLIEGIAYDPVTRAFFLSSVHDRKILRRDATGKLSDFASAADGLAAPLGLAVDAKQRRLWVVSAGLSQAKGLPENARDQSVLLSFDLASGQLRQRIEAPPGKSSWNDLEVGNGRVYVADPGNGTVLAITVGAAPDAKPTIETVAQGQGLASPGGLALSADGKRLYVADWSRGLAMIELGSGALTWLRPPPGATVLGIDGLRRQGDTLIAIQNGVDPPRITRLRLAADGRSLMSAELLERLVPGWDEPTLGVLVDDALAYVSNSHWPAFGDDGASPPGPLSPTLIRRLPLTP